MKKLLIVTAVCNSDYPLALKRAKWMVEMGQKPSHTLLLINDGTVDEDRIKALVEVHLDVFETVVVRRVSTPSDPQWPQGVNHVWREIARNLIGSSPFIDTALFGGWFYFEPDVTPLAPTWFDVLDVQYDFNKKPFMGVKSVVNALRGKTPITITCMNGAGVYPFDISHFSPMMMLGDGAPWDVIGLGGDQQHKIAYIPDSAYVMTYGVTKCKRIDGKITAVKKVQNGDVSDCVFEIKEHLLHHGCKDGSLIDLISKGEKDAVAPDDRLKQSATAWRRKNPIPRKPKQVKPTREIDDEAVRADQQAGMKWPQLIGKYRVTPANLKKILSEVPSAAA